MVFVDYESWFWGLYIQFGETPNIRKFVTDIKSIGNLEDIFFFGDFTREEMVKERAKLRTVTNNIIDCANLEIKKDYTDFIMLDHIYRTILQRNDIEQYVLLTGDGHFHSVVAYLTTFLDKRVGIYAVQGTLSNQLRDCASWTGEILPCSDNRNEYCVKLLQSIDRAQKRGIIPTFEKTVEACAKYYNEDKAKLSASLSKLISDSYICQEMKMLPSGVEIRALVPQWDLIKSHNIRDPNRSK